MTGFSYDEVIDRIIEKNPGNTEGELAKALGIAPNTWTAYKRGERSFGLNEIAEICDTLGVDAEWLLLGAKPASGPLAVEEPGFSLIPRYSVSASAGTGLVALEERPLDQLAFRTDWLRDIGLNPAFCGLIKSAGDSMLPTIPDGAQLLVDLTPGQQLRSGYLYVVVLEGDLLVKRLNRRIDGTIELISDNPLYPKEIVDAQQLDRLTIPGRVAWIGHAV
ncbi:Phage repressor protein C, contains Cro/C1-type HTH and peptisase s24 domains [Pelagibacterium halotolerans]|uniref:HTH cro/C1-type domain-containing protein n=2 Tax=Pelagibacterium TaxID=1082930 RepID=G4RDZ7_PELHB|nr:hypothetical protein KKY_752 [Pelagibacterium halotolerans B2]SDZ95945.1 Phage repressor protein C, contains Cro/C1-type HTH and peptisase s24 domains [Pelagibacterium halotolerans]